MGELVIQRFLRSRDAHLLAQRAGDLRLLLQPHSAAPRSPDFVGVGVQRAGTTWWFSLLLTHPQMRGPRSGRKELHFFDRYQRREAVPRAALRQYRRQFAYPSDLCVGEWTPRYAHDAGSLPLLKAIAPDALILVVLRDPVDRLVSGASYTAARRSGSLESVLEEAVQRSLYTATVKRILSIFSREQVLIQQFESIVREPQRLLDETTDFLSIDRHQIPEDFRGARNERPLRPSETVSTADIDRVAPLLAADALDLARIVPSLDLTLWPSTMSRR